MPRYLLALTSILAFLPAQAFSKQPIQGQTADASLGLEQILMRHIEARGGADAAKGLISLKAAGKVLNIEGAPIVVYFKRPHAFRLEASYYGLKLVGAFDGEVAWQVFPIDDNFEPKVMAEDQNIAIQLLSSFIWGLLTVDEKERLVVERIGVATVGRHACYHLRVTPSSGNVHDVFLGGEDFLIHRLSYQEDNYRVDVMLSDYRPVGGMMLPHTLVRKGGALAFDMVFETVEANAEIEDSLFSMPVKEVAAEQSEPGDKHLP